MEAVVQRPFCSLIPFYLTRKLNDLVYIFNVDTKDRGE